MQIDDNAMIIAKERLLQPNETPTQMIRRVAETVGEDPQQVAEFFWLMDNQYFFPNSPMLANAGTGLNQLAACFVLPVEDSMEGIFGAIKDMAIIQKSGGGTGFSFNDLRPEGAVVTSTGGEASGPISFLKIFNSATEQIKQGGKRRGASLALLNDDHPDILKFIRCKKETGELSNFNISVGVSDKLMVGVMNSEFQSTQIWDAIVQNAWDTGEPGVLFLDTINHYNPTPHLGRIEATNPCWTGDTKVWTVQGFKTFKELSKLGEFGMLVLSQDGDGRLEYKMMRKIGITRRGAELVEIQFDYGEALRCTPDHNIYLKDGTKVKAKNLKAGDSVQACHRHKANSKGYLKLDNGYERVLEHHVVLECSYGRRPDYPNEHGHHADGDKQNNEPWNLSIINAKEHNAMNMLGDQNPMYKVWNERNPLFGISVQREDNPRYRDDIDPEEILEYMKLGYSKGKIAKTLGCDWKTIQRRVEWYGLDRVVAGNHKVVSVSFLTEKEDVYNGVVDDNHNYYVATSDNCAVLSANCGEANLLPYESCFLGSINLSKMVQGGKLIWGLLANVTHLAVKMLDNAIDASTYPLPQIEEMTKGNRKIGVGIMGLADMFFKLGIPYNSAEALALAEQIMERINGEAIGMSHSLTVIKGEYLNRQEGTPLVRNAAVTSIAPTGTLAPFAGCTFSAEPCYGLVYTKTILDGKEMYEVNPVFKEELENRGIYSQELLDKVARNGGSCQGIKEIPGDMQKVFLTAYDITPLDHVQMQAVLQKHVQQSVSKTINLPKTATVEEVGRVMFQAWELGCKGVTVYRDGSRENQVLSTEKHTPTERPAVLDGQTHKFKTGCGSLYVTVNKNLVGEPQELFVAHSQKQGCVNALLNSLARVTSISLRSGVDPDVVSEAMKGQVCGTCSGITSCADALGQALEVQGQQVCQLGCSNCG